MKFVVIDNEKLTKVLNNGSCDIMNCKVEIEGNSLEEVIEKVKKIKPHAGKIQMECFKGQEYCEFKGAILATNDEIFIYQIE